MGKDIQLFSKYCITPELLLFEQKMKAREISTNRIKLKNTINVKTGKPLKSKTIKKYESDLKSARREVKINSEIIKQMVNYNLLEKPFLQYPFLPCNTNEAQDYKMLGNFARFIEMIENQKMYFHDDLHGMVRFVLDSRHPKVSGRLVSGIIGLYVDLLREVIGNLKKLENPKVINLFGPKTAHG